MRRLTLGAVFVLALALGVLVGALIGHSAKSHASTVTVAGAVTTVRAAALPTRTVTHVVVHTHTVTQTVTQQPAAVNEEGTPSQATEREGLESKMAAEKAIFEREPDGSEASDLAKDEYESDRAQLQQLNIR